MNENQIKCRELVEEFANQYINWEEGKCLILSNGNVDYSVKIYKKSRNRKLFVVYNGVRRSKIIKFN